MLVTRDTTERPEAVEEGTVLLVGTDTKKIINETQKLISDAAYYKKLKFASQPLWRWQCNFKNSKFY